MISFVQPDTHLWELVRAYLHAKESIINLGFAHEVDWQNEISLDAVTEGYFLRESAWVILSSGMRETVIRKKFGPISKSFLNWKSGKAISRRSDSCRTSALAHFNHEPKIEAIIAMADHVYAHGFETVFENIKEKGIGYISQFPYMGPATSFHLAKNIGLPVAKPDRHLIRIANAVGYSSPDDLCADIGQMVGDKVAVVDLVLWRYATIFGDYLKIFPDPKYPRIDWDDCGFCLLKKDGEFSY